ncbi:uncharacterized protein [Procambarus clarkii]|uniref:uncharacterized protein n=1 Tax=Procambarus clarkii TaxID=6728 RepID=UPI001E6780D3|nr:uncharacterized protein LOC123757074 [Procambarus clarkii]
MCLLQTPEALIHENQYLFSTNSSQNWLHEVSSGRFQPLSRMKRVIGVPAGSFFEIKWSLNFPYDTYTFSKIKLQFGLPIRVGFPYGIVVGGAGKRSVDAGYGEEEDVDGADHSTDSFAHWYQPKHSNQLELHEMARRAARQERLSFYNNLIGTFNETGVDGLSCLLRVICEVAEAPFDQGLLGELINTLLTASLAGHPDTEEERKDYGHFIEAELHGKLEGDCETRYYQCEASPFDLIPNAIHRVF